MTQIRLLLLAAPLVSVIGVLSMGAAALIEPEPTRILAPNDADWQHCVAWLHSALHEEKEEKVPAAFSQEKVPAAFSQARRVLLSSYAPGRPPRRYVLENPKDHNERSRWLTRVAEELAWYPASHLKLELQVTEDEPLRLWPKATLLLRLHHGRDGLAIQGDDEDRIIFPTEPLEKGVKPERVFASYLREPTQDGASISCFRTDAVVIRASDWLFWRSNRNQPVERSPVSREQVREAIRAGADFLARHQQPSGRFTYIYDPLHDRRMGGYNLLRHAGTAFALYQAFSLFKDPAHLEAAERAIDWLIAHHIRNEHNFSFVLSGNVAKLGGAALTLLALTERAQSISDGKHDQLMNRLARFIEHQMQDDGELESYYAWSDAQDTPERTSIYYPGEATFALARLYEISGNERWLRDAARAADYMIARGKILGMDAVVFPDAWLLCGLSLLFEQTGDRELLEYALTIAHRMLEEQYRGENEPALDGGFIDPVFSQSTPAATRAEGLGCLYRALDKAKLHEKREELRQSLHATTRFQLAQQATNLNSHFYENPERAHGGFFGSAVSHSMRIDYTQHNISALIYALRSLPREPQP